MINSTKNILITGGAGFIGSALIRFLIKNTEDSILNIDKLTYAGIPENLRDIDKSPRYKFVKGDICNKELISKCFSEFKPDIVMHLAAESHVDRSIEGPSLFIDSNIIGTYTMLEVSRNFINETAREFIFHHISTDEVYGSLGSDGLFTEQSPYDPSSPYSASKAASDHLVRAWNRTYKLPVIITNCSNNFGPFQFPEKLIPVTILNAIQGKKIPIYGNGLQIRDWLYVDDHASALYKVVTLGKNGDTYNIGGNNEKTNIEVVNSVCQILDEIAPAPKNLKITSYKDLISHVQDRPGHDSRYAIDSTKVQKEIGWEPKESFESGLYKTVEWYLKNTNFCNQILKNS